MNDLLIGNRIEPDVDELLAVLRRERVPRRVHHIELFLDEEVREQVGKRYELLNNLDLSRPQHTWEAEVRVHRFLGYDIFRAPVIRKDFFALPELEIGDTASSAQNRGDRAWVDEHQGPIQTVQDFEQYSWPKIEDIDFGPLEWMEKNLPPNMGVYDLTAHILEMVTFLMGYEKLCYAMFENMELVEMLCRRIGEFYTAYTRSLCDFDRVSVIWGSDDMGFRTSTMVSPEFLRSYILPWHKTCAQIAHEHGKLYLLHACGNLEEIMDDLIDEVKVDGKHSFEDTIQSVTTAFRQFGPRTAILGGIDVDFLCRASEADIRQRVRDTLEVCMGGTGYCLGTGNTVANYIPLENYLIMLDEGRRFTLSP